jgi:hypothetical protein
VRAEERKRTYELPVSGFNEIPIAEYGYSETKKTITDIVTQVTTSYKFGSIEELNAILRQCNIQAFVRNYRSGKQGLVYSIVDRNGHKKGIPIKASAIYGNPTLANLTKKFERTKAKKEFFRSSVQNRTVAALRHSKNSAELNAALQSKKLACSIYFKTDGSVEQIFFTDHKTKSVFSASDLGLLPGVLLSRFDQKDAVICEVATKKEISLLLVFGYVLLALTHKLLEQLLRPEYTGPALDPEFLRKKKKRKR